MKPRLLLWLHKNAVINSQTAVSGYKTCCMQGIIQADHTHSHNAAAARLLHLKLTCLHRSSHKSSGSASIRSLYCFLQLERQKALLASSVVLLLHSTVSKTCSLSSSKPPWCPGRVSEWAPAQILKLCTSGNTHQKELKVNLQRPLPPTVGKNTTQHKIGWDSYKRRPLY